jgi:hypothetical protein
VVVDLAKQVEKMLDHMNPKVEVNPLLKGSTRPGNDDEYH